MSRLGAFVSRFYWGFSSCEAARSVTYVRTFVFLVALGLARVEAVEETAGRALLQREAALRALVAQL